MVHGDNEGLKLPPYIAPIQAMVVPIKVKDENNLRVAKEITKKLKQVGIRAEIDLTDKSAGFKFADSEMKGIPLRIEIGPKDIENNKCVFVRRDTKEKFNVMLPIVQDEVKIILEYIQKNMFDIAKNHLDTHINPALTKDELINKLDTNPGLIKAMHCGDEECEKVLKDETGITVRCIAFEQDKISDVCPICGKPAKYQVLYGRTY